jgi:predicted ATPase
MTSPRPCRSVITGGPGTGKSALLEAAALAGLATSGEVARDILREPGGMALRARDPTGFAEAMLARELAAFRAAAAPKAPVIFDRGFPDIVGFLALAGLPVSAELDEVCRTLRYDGPIFRAPPWRGIYVSDRERIQSWDDACASDRAVSAAWARYGYSLVDLPLMPVEERLRFVLDALRDETGGS